MTMPYNGAPHPRRQRPTSTASTVLLAVSAFLFTGWMLAHGHSPVVAVSTTSAVLAVTITLSRSRLLPQTRPVVLWQDNER